MFSMRMSLEVSILYQLLVFEFSTTGIPIAAGGLLLSDDCCGGGRSTIAPFGNV